MVDLERHSVVDVLEPQRRERKILVAKASDDRGREPRSLWFVCSGSQRGRAPGPPGGRDAIASARSQQRRARLAHRLSSGNIRHASSFAAAGPHLQRDCKADRIRAPQHRELAYIAPRDRNRAALNPTSPLYFEAFLAECWKNGNRIGRHLFYDIKNRGYTGSRSHLERLLKVWREVENIKPYEPPPEMDVSEPVRDPHTGHMVSSVVAAALCIKPRGLLTDSQARKVNALKQGSRAFAIMRGLAMRFNGILRGRSSQALDEWIDDAVDTELTAIMRFASVLRRDIHAVKNAIELPWSNGQAEGQINRLKMLKRAMYGRAGPELMRARMLPLNHTN